MSGNNVVVLTGGVGGAKLVLGLTHIIEPARITAIVNTGDDFRHLGLYISPDLDTLLYTLSGKSNVEQGWGRADESFGFMASLRSLGEEDWFLLGDKDLALHVTRTAHLFAGLALSTITRQFAAAWNVNVNMLPMSDDAVSTCVRTDEGDLSFQQYFVKRRCQPKVMAVHFEGALSARPAAGVIEAIDSADTRAILIAPSNPYLSIDPILAIPGIRAALTGAKAPIVAVSPLVEGKAVKGPTAKIMQELGIPVTSQSIGAHYGALIDGMLIDERDPAGDSNLTVARSNTMMLSLADRERVAAAALALADRMTP